MNRAAQAILHPPAGTGAADYVGSHTDEIAPISRSINSTDVRISIVEDLADIEPQWRAFERVADCTIFQSFEWLSAWQNHIGTLCGTQPSIVTGRDSNGNLLFAVPLAVEPRRFARTLTFLGSDLGDYNAPMLAPDFAQRLPAAQFVPLWREAVERIRSHPRLGFDVVHFERMPDKVGNQPNPMLRLSAQPHPSSAYVAALSHSWADFYAAKRSPATRRRDRSKRKRMTDYGEVRFVSATGGDDAARTLDVMITQKRKQFAAMGVPDLFSNRGYRAFYGAIVASAGTGPGVHVSRLEIGDVMAAVNLGAVFRDRYYHLQASHIAGELGRLGPGTAHLHELMQYAIGLGCRSFDFTVGDEAYKREWSDNVVALYDHVAPVTARGTLAAAQLKARRALKHWIKQTPTAWRAFTAVRAAGASLRR